MWDLIDNFILAFNIYFIPREENALVDSLVVSAILFRIPLPPKIKCGAKIRYRPSILDNVKHWKVFEDNLDIEKFLQFVDDFSALHIDQNPDPKGDPHSEVFLNKNFNHHIV